METVILGIATALLVFALWIMARHDWLRVTLASVRIDAQVVGHVSSWDEGRRIYRARMAFELNGKPVEVIDPCNYDQEWPPVGTSVRLSYPRGRPDLARIPRPLTWSLVYLTLLASLSLLIAKFLGWLE